MKYKLLEIAFNGAAFYIVYALLSSLVFHFYHFEIELVLGFLGSIALAAIMLIALFIRLMFKVKDSFIGKFIYSLLGVLISIPIYIATFFVISYYANIL